MYNAVIIEGRRDAYSPMDVGETMTVGELIARLKEFDEDTLIFIGNDEQSYGYYTYGRVDVTTADLEDMPDNPVYDSWEGRYVESEEDFDKEEEDEERRRSQGVAPGRAI